MMRGRNGDQWKASFHAAPWVSYAEALCWIFYRDVDAIAELDVLAFREDVATVGTSMASFMLSRMEPPGEWAAANPELALRDALEAGRVTASAKLLVRSPRESGKPAETLVTERRDMDRDEWHDLSFLEAPAPYDKGAAAYPKGYVVGADAPHIFFDVLFSRADLTTAFPGAGANEVVRLASVSAPVAGPGSMTDFIRSDSRLASARRAIVAAGEEITKGAMLRMLAQHFHDEGGDYSSPTIGGLAASMKATAGRLGLTLDEMNRKADRGDRKG